MQLDIKQSFKTLKRRIEPPCILYVRGETIIKKNVTRVSVKSCQIIDLLQMYFISLSANDRETSSRLTRMNKKEKRFASREVCLILFVVVDNIILHKLLRLEFVIEFQTNFVNYYNKNQTPCKGFYLILFQPSEVVMTFIKKKRKIVPSSNNVLIPGAIYRKKVRLLLRVTFKDMT